MTHAYRCTSSLVAVFLGFVSPIMAQTLQPLTTVTVNTGPLDGTVTPTTLYLANFGTNTLQLYDVTKPASPVLRGTFDNNANQRIRSVVVNGTTAYVTCYGTGSPSSCRVQAVDVSSDTAPKALGNVTLPGGPASVAAASALVCVTTQPQGPEQGILYVYDTALKPLGSISTGGTPVQVVLQGTLAYVVNRQSSALQIFDVSTPATPRLVSTTPTGNSPTSVLLDGSFAYVNDAQGVRTFDITNPAAPLLRATTASVSLGAIAGSYGYGVRNGKLQAYSLPATGTPALLAEASVEGNVTDVSASGTIIYTVEQLRVQVFQFLPVVTSAASAKRAAFRCFPNPTNGQQMQVELASSTHTQTVTVYNSLGQVVRKVTLPAGAQRASLDVSGVTKGTYTVRSGEAAQRIVIE